MSTKRIHDSLISGVWGTVGPQSQEAAKRLAQCSGGRYALLTHSAYGAMEVTLRSLGLGRGDRLLCGERSYRIDGETAALLGIRPVFSPVDQWGDLIPMKVEESLIADPSIRVVVEDLGNEESLKALAAICRAQGVSLVVNAGKAVGRKLDHSLFYAAIYDLDACGGVSTDREDIYALLFTWHHCGHAPGVGASITFDAILGGDFRVTEFAAIAALDRLEENVKREILEKVFFRDSEAFSGPYYEKLVGKRS